MANNLDRDMLLKIVDLVEAIQSGGSGNGLFIVNVSYDENEDSYVSDKTIAQIASAFTNCNLPIVYADNYGLKQVFMLKEIDTSAGSEVAYFSNIGVSDGQGVSEMSFAIDGNGVTLETYNYPSNT